MIRLLAWAALPGLLVALVVGTLLVAPFWLDPSRRSLPAGTPTVEQLAFERVLFDDAGIAALVRAGPGGPVRIAQVQVDGAFWQFAQDPLGALPRLSAGWLRIPYPWVHGEGHEISVVTSRGGVFRHRVPIAVPTVARANLPLAGLLAAGFGLLPLLLRGAVPALLGAGDRGGGDVAFGVSVALQAFLLVAAVRVALDSLAEAFPVTAGGMQVWLAATATGAGLIGIGCLGRAAPAGRAAIAAVGGAAHRLCQGLAVGGAVALENLVLACCLAFGFLVHNLLAGSALRHGQGDGRSRWAARLTVAAALGLPPLVGVWLGAQAAAPVWAALALASGAGAILQVVAGAVRLLVHHAARWAGSPGAGLLATAPALLAASHLAA